MEKLNILVAMDAFKGTLSSMALAEWVEKGIREILPGTGIHKIGVADGGEGTVDALVGGTGGVRKSMEVTGPLGSRVMAAYGIIPDGTRVIEVAAASGLTLIPESRRNPMKTTSAGTGELIRAALEAGCHKIILGLGGSATNDGGMGMARALGISFTDKDGNALGPGGGELTDLHAIDTSDMMPQLAECEFVIAGDVSNPLCGPRGASRVYGPQKGATARMAETLDRNLYHYGKQIEAQYGKEVMTIPGAGAAGGMAVPLLAFGGRVKTSPGIDVVLDAIGFNDRLRGMDLVVTGEGSMDEQTLSGKVPVGVAVRARKNNIPVIAIVGRKDRGTKAIYDCGIDAIFPIPTGPMSLARAMENTGPLVMDAAGTIARLMRIAHLILDPKKYSG